MCGEVIDPNSYTDVPFTWLEDDSYTISYSLTDNPETEGWISFHDYIPDYSICLRNEKLLQFYTGLLYEMNIGPSGTYFGYMYDSYITPVIVSNYRTQNTIYPFLIKSLNWNTDIEDLLIRRLQETWTSISLHNSFQGTKQIPLILFDTECSLLEQYGVFNTKRVKNRWYFNYAFNQKVSTSTRTWLELRDKFLVVNTQDIACEIKPRLFDDFVIIKLVFNNNQSKKLFHYEINAELLIATQ